MTNRTRFLLILAGILAIAALLIPKDRQEPVPTEWVRVVVASHPIEPYAIIESGQVKLGPEKPLPLAASDFYTATDQLEGLMTTRFIKPGQAISREDAKSIAEVRYVDEMGLEIVSFPAVFSEMVAGQVRPGHRVNIYGYYTEDSRDMPGETILVAGNVWVVDVRTSGGSEARPATPEAPLASSGGILTAPSIRREAAEPGSILTVAASPEVVRSIIDAFGAKRYQAWVTLAPSPKHIPSVPTPSRTPAPFSAPTPTDPSAQTPEADNSQAAPFSISAGAIHMSYKDDGPKVDEFPNTTSTVWAIVALQYSPDGPLDIRIEIKKADSAEMVFGKDYVHPSSGQESYLITLPGGFTPDTRYRTTLRAGGRDFTADWQLRSNAPLPFTGDEDPGTGND